MTDKNHKFYITAAIPYVNARPHIGHALEFVQADTIARYQKLLGRNSLTLSGGDENALKNVQAAEAAGVELQEFVDTNTQIFFDLTKKLNAVFDIWQKGSDTEKHYPACKKLWELCEKNGDIYKKTYGGLYCVGCEAFYTPEELNPNLECWEHPGKRLETVEEENYFFRLSKYQESLTSLITSDRLQIIPQKRKREALSFIQSGLEDISISRSNQRAKNWGIPVPGDPTQRMYVWFDALNIYQSGIGFGWNEKQYTTYWPADVHVIGKGILRFHAVYWPAFLLSAGLQLPRKIFVHEYFTVNGQKMSKTLGNVVDPFDVIEKFGTDSLRYYFLAKFSPFLDGDWSEDKFIETYNADLANGLGNLIARSSAMIVKSELEFEQTQKQLSPGIQDIFEEAYEFDKALADIWVRIKKCDTLINQKRVWELTGKEQQKYLAQLVDQIRQIGIDLKPFLPDTAEKISIQFAGPKIKTVPPLFPRL